MRSNVIIKNKRNQNHKFKKLKKIKLQFNHYYIINMRDHNFLSRPSNLILFFFLFYLKSFFNE